MNTTDIVNYYVNLLAIQYRGLPKATATVRMMAGMGIMPQTPSVQTISFAYVPSQGAFVLAFDGVNSPSINWNDSAATIQTKLRTIAALAAVTVSGNILTDDEPQLSVTMVGVTPVPADLLTVVSSTLMGSVPSDVLVTEDISSIITTEDGDEIATEGPLVAITPVIGESDLTLPLAIMNGYNLIGPNPAVGVQLDVLGKYAGVTRNGFGFNGQPIMLNDADFLMFILMTIIKNNSGSSLSIIQQLINQYFAGDIFVFDHLRMRMSYLISTALSSDLLQMFVMQGVLPKPMAVSLSITYVPTPATLFGFGAYNLPVNPPNRSPFNTYASYQTNRPFLTYSDFV